MIVVAVSLRVIDLFRTFDTIYIITFGGPGHATELLPFYIYRARSAAAGSGLPAPSPTSFSSSRFSCSSHSSTGVESGKWRPNYEGERMSTLSVAQAPAADRGVAWKKLDQARRSTPL